MKLKPIGNPTIPNDVEVCGPSILDQTVHDHGENARAPARAIKRGPLMKNPTAHLESPRPILKTRAGFGGCCGPSIQWRWTAHEVVRRFKGFTAVDLESNGREWMCRSRKEQGFLTRGTHCQRLSEREEGLTHVNSAAAPPVSDSAA